MTIKFLISVDQSQHVLIKPGQKVDFKTPLLKKAYQNEIKLPVAQALDIPPQKIFLTLLKLVGETIKKGEVIAKNKAFFSEKKYVSNYDGIIKEINHEEGYLLLTTTLKAQETINSYFKGEIVDVKKNEITLKVDDVKVFDLKEAARDFGGEVLFIKPGEIANFDQEKITNKVVFIENIQPYNQAKLEVIGASGFVTLQQLVEKTSLPDAQIKNPSDWPVIQNLNYPYCLISKKGSTIYLYK